MKKIDMFSHFLFPKLLNFIEDKTGHDHEFSRLFANNRPLFDPEARIKLMDDNNVDISVLVPQPEIGIIPEIKNNPSICAEAARIGNNEMAKLIQKYPNRFAGVAMIPTINADIMVSELERSVKELKLVGGVIGAGSSLKSLDHPDFDKLFAKASELDVPIWIHPARPSNLPDYLDEECGSKYQYFQAFGWLSDSTLAMHRIIFSGVFDRYPNLRIIIHHHGALIPYFAGRIDIGVELFEANAGIKCNTPISPPYLDHYKKFYIDTATQYYNPDSLEIAVKFFGVDRVFFGSDAPMDKKGGDDMIKNAFKSVEALKISDKQREQIYFKNAKALLKLD